MDLLIGTQKGIATVDGPASRAFVPLSITGLAPADGNGWWATAEEDGRHTLVRVDADLSGHEVGSPAPLNCVIDLGGEVLAGASEARLYRREGTMLAEDASFRDAPGRDTWYTPWGGPPDVRTMSVSDGGVLFVNVHVGGIVRRDADGWRPTIDIDADVHQVLCVPGRPDTVLAATARGLAASPDLGRTWSSHADGLHARYSRAVAVSGDVVFLSASDAPGGRRAAVFRASLDDLSFERCSTGLPEWFSDNVDSGCIAATPDGAVHVADRNGTIFRTDDDGVTWDQEVGGLPPITVLGSRHPGP